MLRGKNWSTHRSHQQYEKPDFLFLKGNQAHVPTSLMNWISNLAMLFLVSALVFGCANSKIHSESEIISYEGLSPKKISQLFISYDCADSSSIESKKSKFMLPSVRVSPRKGNKKTDVCDLINHPMVSKYFSEQIRTEIIETTKLADCAISNSFFHPAVHEYNVLRTWNLGESDFYYDGGDSCVESSRQASFNIIEFGNGHGRKDRYAVEMKFLFKLHGSNWQLVDIEVHCIEYEYKFTTLLKELAIRKARYLEYQNMNLRANQLNPTRQL